MLKNLGHPLVLGVPRSVFRAITDGAKYVILKAKVTKNPLVKHDQ